MHALQALMDYIMDILRDIVHLPNNIMHNYGSYELLLCDYNYIPV